MKSLLLFSLLFIFTFCSMANGDPLPGFAAPPNNWVDNTICNPSGGNYFIDATLGITNNIGPNVTGSAIGQPYAVNQNGLRDFVNNWRDDADGVGGAAHYADASWRLKMPVFALTSVSNASGGNTTYTGIITGGSGTNSFVGATFEIIGFTNPLNNGQFVVQSVTASTIILNNPNGVAATQNAGARVVIHGSSYDGNNALLSSPGKINTISPPTGVINISGNAVTWVSGSVFSNSWKSQTLQLTISGYLYNFIVKSVTDNHDLILSRSAGTQTGVTYTIPEPFACLDIEPTIPLPLGTTVCNHDSPDVNARVPGCGNDRKQMWLLQPDTVSAPGFSGIEVGADVNTISNWANHIIYRNLELTVTPGAISSKAGAFGFELFHAGSRPVGGALPAPAIASSHIACIGCYIHGWDAGDLGQPLGVSSEDSQNNCKAWDYSGTITAAPDGGNPGTSIVTYVSGKHFGMTYTPGSTIYLNGIINTPFNGTPYIIANTSYTQGVLNGTQNNQLSVTGSVTFVSAVPFNSVNPPNGIIGSQTSPKYTPGCGDDIQVGIAFNVDYGWLQDSYVEKIHFFGNESHAMTYCFSNGPLKVVNNHIEGGSETVFSGGTPADVAGGPCYDTEFRKNYFGKDLNLRQLSATASNSPSPPFGCGPTDGTASHNTCPFNYDLKNTFEMKAAHYSLVDGNTMDCDWADGQSGFCILYNLEAGSGGQFVGVYDPFSGLPTTAVDNIRFSNNWIRNGAQPIQSAGRGDLDAADGGGITLPAKNYDFINNIFSNFHDIAQFGNPGFIWQYASAGGYWFCNMSYTGSVTPFTIQANCIPPQNDLTSPAHVSSIIVDGSNNVTILHSGTRLDPILSTSPSGTCVATGASWTTCPITVGTGIAGLTSGSFAMTDTVGAQPQPWATDGTGAARIVYNDGASAAGTVCSGTGTNGGSPPGCYNSTILGGVQILSFASLNSKMTGISLGDNIYASNKAGDTTCGDNGYAVGAGPTSGQQNGIKADSNTITTGLYVEWQQTAEPTASSALCRVFNGSGFPQNVTVQYNTFLMPQLFAIEVFSQFYSPSTNYFHDNLWIDYDLTTKSDMYTTQTGAAGEGTTAFNAWDLSTFEFYHNVMQGRASGNWSVISCPGGTCTNSFPTTVTCAGSDASGGDCIGYTGYMNGTAFQTGPCNYDGSNPLNCPLMPTPWAGNLTLAMLQYVSSSVYKSQGANLTQLQTAMTQNIYICPLGLYCYGLSCANGGPCPDNPTVPSLPPTAPATNMFATVVQNKDNYEKINAFRYFINNN